MIRKAFLMKLHAGCVAEYKKRHDAIWPELEALLKAQGVHNYSISFLEKTSQLFAYAEIENEQKWADIAKAPVCQEWWEYMSDIMETNDDKSPVCEPLEEVFYLA